MKGAIFKGLLRDSNWGNFLHQYLQISFVSQVFCCKLKINLTAVWWLQVSFDVEGSSGRKEGCVAPHLLTCLEGAGASPHLWVTAGRVNRTCSCLLQ